MAAVVITQVSVQNNPAAFMTPFAFEIQYECLTALADDLEWKMTYVGSAENENEDQVLDSVLVGPVLAGNYRFVFEGNPPDPNTLPADDILGVTVVFLNCFYRGKEFIRIGYYVNVEYQDEELRENPPERPVIDKLCRNVLADQPRVTRFPIDFDNVPAAGTSADGMAVAQDGGGGDASMDDAPAAAGGMDPAFAMEQQQQQDASGRSGFDMMGQQQQQQQQQHQLQAGPPMPGLADGGYANGIGAF